MGQNKQTLSPELKLGVLTLFWGFAVMFSQYALQGTVPFVVLTIRFALASLILLPWVEGMPWSKVRSGTQGSSSAAPILQGGLLLGLVLFAGYTFQILGLLYTTVSRNGFLSYTYAIFVPFLQVAITRKMPGISSLIGLVAVLVGMFFLTGSFPNNQGFEGGLNLGDILSLGAAVCFALHIVLVNKVGDTGRPVLVTVTQSSVVAILSIVCIPLWPELYLVPSFATLGSMVWLAIFPTALAFLGQNKWQHLSTPLRAVLIYSLDPLIGFAIGVVLFGDPMGLSQILGGALIIGGILVSELGALGTLSQKAKHQ